MTPEPPPLVVGAGPVGLAAALFLARQGRMTRVIETRDEPSRLSKALAVNPRTLELLQASGVTGRMLERGKRIVAASIYRGQKLARSVALDGVHPRYPFMLALSQATSERLLADALREAGVVVERGTRLVDFRATDAGVEADLERAGVAESVDCPWLLAADGAHSTVRHGLGSDFPGSSMAEPWRLVDTPLRTTLAADHAHVFLLERGSFLFMLPVVEDDREPPVGDPVWRVISSRDDPLRGLPMSEPTGAPVWTSEFHVAHRCVASMAVGGVYLAGDAAHLHSPFGARGMNLGIEDAWVFAGLACAGRLDEYDNLRRPVDHGVVRLVEGLTNVVTARRAGYRLLRWLVMPRALCLPPVRRRMKAALTGQDHALPASLR